MPAVVVFLIFVICLILAIPVSISLGIASVLPGAVDPSFTASGTYVIRSMLGGIDSFPLLAVPMFVLSGIIMARGGISRKLFDVFAYFMGKRNGRFTVLVTKSFIYFIFYSVHKFIVYFLSTCFIFHVLVSSRFII